MPFYLISLEFGQIKKTWINNHEVRGLTKLQIRFNLSTIQLIWRINEQEGPRNNDFRWGNQATHVEKPCFDAFYNNKEDIFIY